MECWSLEQRHKRVTVLRYPIDFAALELEMALKEYGKVVRLKGEMLTGMHADDNHRNEGSSAKFHNGERCHGRNLLQRGRKKMCKV